MTAIEIMSGVMSVGLAYLLGSIPSAYLFSVRLKKKDIRHMGEGNVGGMNVFREIGTKSGIAVVVLDMVKGAAAVSIAYWVLGLPQLFVLAAGIAAVAGHLWMIFLKFSGGGGIATSLGVLVTLLPAYGYWPELLVFIGIGVTVIIITRNVSAGAVVGLLFLPLIIWLGTHSLPVTIFTFALGCIMGLKRLPSLKRDWAREGNIKNFIFKNSFRRNRR